MIGNKMVVFAAHPDDETFACGGTIIRKIQDEYDVHVVVMTDGRHSHDIALGLQEPPPAIVAETRARELSEATRILGVDPEKVVLLGFEDTKLRQHMATAKERTVQILHQTRPVEVYVPYREDGHEDHRATYEVVMESVDEINLPTKLYEYPVWNWKPPVSGLKVVVVDVHKELARKMEAISKYQSQISKCFPKQEKPVLSDDFVKMFCSGIEKFYTME
jgi:LmbE family N-acetylglucosaminyl deacetylase